MTDREQQIITQIAEITKTNLSLAKRDAQMFINNADDSEHAIARINALKEAIG